MKLLVFAHTPPPHHGQSYMVELMLNGLGGDCRATAGTSRAGANPYGIECFHINAQVSKELEDIGGFRTGKLLLLLRFCMEAIWCRFRHGVRSIYYVPAPGKKSALYRDWIVMLLCRPFFSRVILHWHAAGLGHWLETHVGMRMRSMTYRCMRGVDLSIALSDYNKADAGKLLPKSICVVNNGIPDPCPDYETLILPRRRARFAARRMLAQGAAPDPGVLQAAGGDPGNFKLLYLAHCTREKGLFDTLNGVMLANRALRERHSPFRVTLEVAGLFVNESERHEFDALVAGPDLSGCVKYLGFVQDAAKRNALLRADLFCFPSYYRNENQPVNLIEAMAFGLPILTTRWRSIPELLPPDYPDLVEIRSPAQVAGSIVRCLNSESPPGFRKAFLDNFTIEAHLASLAAAFRSVDPDCPAVAKAPAAAPVLQAAAPQSSHRPT